MTLPPTGPRILLFTGKGGVGKSTIASGTAALAAATGRRTLVLSTDSAHSLADAFGIEVGSEPTPVADNLFVQHIDAQARFERSWADIQSYLLSVLTVAGVDSVSAEELTILPGAEEIFALLELRERALEGAWDVVVVDCAPTAETLRLLAMPEALGWYMQRLFGLQRSLVASLRPVLTRATGMPLPGTAFFEALQRLHGELEEVRTLLSGPRASIRVVLTPERMVVAEARRAYTTLSLFGYRVDGVVANRVFPEVATGPRDSWRDGWVDAQRGVLADVEASFSGLSIWRAAYLPGEPAGVTALRSLATELYGADDPFAEPEAGPPLRITSSDRGAVLHLSLPLAGRRDVDLARTGDELVVTVGSYRRLLSLPASLSRHQVSAARLEQGELQVRFHEVSV
ncbi:ArsA family ATPase [Nocardioides sp.]|uniref:ArsA family ATPase n=1 Tax=Nocardioides sp. TaxID=35761 RepID=UPI003D0ACEF4